MPCPVHVLDSEAPSPLVPRNSAVRLAALRVPQGAIVVCDAVTDAYLAVIVEAAQQAGAGCLLAGAAGLARPLARQLAETKKALQPADACRNRLAPPTRPRPGGRIGGASAPLLPLPSTSPRTGG